MRHRFPPKRFDLLALLRTSLSHLSQSGVGSLLHLLLRMMAVAFTGDQPLERALLPEAAQFEKAGQHGIGLH